MVKRWANQATLKVFLKIIGKKLFISNSNKMQPPPNASKVRHSIPAVPYKSEKHIRNI